MDSEVRPLFGDCDKYSALHENIETIIEAHFNSDIYAHGETNVVREEYEHETITKKSSKAIY